MKLLLENLNILLIGAAIGQLAIAILNLRLDKILKWDLELQEVSLLLREVFYVHKWFITLTLTIFGIITLRFAGDISTGAHEICRWFAAGVGGFWAVRTLIQWFYYSKEHWLGKTKETVIHWVLTICYGGAATTYLVAAFT